MLKNAKCIKLTNVLKNVYKDIINNGIVLQNFNISLISPIGKKDSNTSDPEDFRPISVSSVFSNIYEMIILNQILFWVSIAFNGVPKSFSSFVI